MTTPLASLFWVETGFLQLAGLLQAGGHLQRLQLNSGNGVLEEFWKVQFFAAPPEGCGVTGVINTIFWYGWFQPLRNSSCHQRKWGGGGLLPGDLGAVLPFVSTGADLGVTRVASMASTWDSSSTGMREVWGGRFLGNWNIGSIPQKKPKRNPIFRPELRPEGFWNQVFFTLPLKNGVSNTE